MYVIIVLDLDLILTILTVIDDIILTSYMYELAMLINNWVNFQMMSCFT